MFHILRVIKYNERIPEQYEKQHFGKVSVPLLKVESNYTLVLQIEFGNTHLKMEMSTLKWEEESGE